MFKIGEFSKLVRVSPRMLRHYEKCGLLYPAEIDRFTGYRRYSAAQIPLLTHIVTLRDMAMRWRGWCVAHQSAQRPTNRIRQTS